MSLTWDEVCARRLVRHGLSEAVPAGDLVGQVGVLCGAHAQLMSAAELSIGLRVAGITRTDVREALWTQRSLVKTYGPRGTVHLLPSRDLATWNAALLAAVPPPGTLPPGLRMSRQQTDDVIAAIASALLERDLTIDELHEAVVARTGPWAGDLVMPAFTGLWPRWRQAITLAAHRGALCFGPNRGRNVTFSSPSRWAPGLARTDERTALAAVVRWYLHAYGPATPQQFARWLGSSKPAAVELFDSLTGELEQVDLDGVRSWVNAGDAAAVDDPRDAGDPSSAVRLLPYFDAYVVGCHPRDRVFPGLAAARALVGGQAGPVPVLLLDGVVSGVWHQRRSGRAIAITVEPFGRLTARQRRELGVQAERIGSILEGRVELSIGEVTAGAHR